MKFVYLTAIATGLQAVATILSALRVITVSMRTITDNPENGHEEPKRRSAGSGLHKWIMMSGAVVGLVTIAYLESVVNNVKGKKQSVKEVEKFEQVYVSS
jgi:hypothetical protein